MKVRPREIGKLAAAAAKVKEMILISNVGQLLRNNRGGRWWAALRGIGYHLNTFLNVRMLVFRVAGIRGMASP